MDNFEFVYELNRATNALNSYIDACIVKRSGLTRAQCVTLMLIERFPDITKASLARKLNSSHVAVGRLVGVLSNKGYVSSTPSKENSHTVYLRVTVEGKETIEAVRTVFSRQSADLFAHVATELDVFILSNQLRTFADILPTYKQKL